MGQCLAKPTPLPAEGPDALQNEPVAAAPSTAVVVEQEVGAAPHARMLVAATTSCSAVASEPSNLGTAEAPPEFEAGAHAVCVSMAQLNSSPRPRALVGSSGELLTTGDAEPAATDDVAAHWPHPAAAAALDTSRHGAAASAYCATLRPNGSTSTSTFLGDSFATLSMSHDALDALVQPQPDNMRFVSPHNLLLDLAVKRVLGSGSYASVYEGGC